MIKIFIRKIGKLETLIWFIIASTIVAYTYPVLTNSYLAGWDLIGHYYLFERMIDTISLNSSIHSYDTYWYGGYSTYVLYSPLFYFLLSIVYFLTFGFFSKLLIFNIATFFLPFIFLASLRYAVKNIINKEAVPIGIIFGFFFLMSPLDFAHLGVGLNGIYYMGFLPQYLAICFFLIFFAKLYNLNEKTNKKELIKITVLFSCILYTHILTSIFLLFLLFIFFAFNIKLYKKILLIVGFGLILASPWLVRFINYLPYSSGKTIGLNTFKDPFLMMFPRIEGIIEIFLNKLPKTEIQTKVNSYLMNIEFSPFISLFPYITILSMVLCFLGILATINSKQKWLTFSFIIIFIFLPREIFSELFNFGIHYYRFTTYLILLNIFIITYGYINLKEKITTLKNKFFRLTAKGILWFFIAICLVQACFFTLDWNQTNYFGHYKNFNPKYKLLTSKYENEIYYKKLLLYLFKNRPTGRIFIETTGAAIFNIGSPHYLPSILPLKLDTEILPGLIAESALSTSFINGALSTKSDHMGWGRNPFSSNIATSKKFNSYLSKSNLVELVFTCKRFNLFKVKNFSSKIMQSNVKPFLFVAEKNALDFRSFAEFWYHYPKLFNYPVIYTNKKFKDIPMSEKSKLAGVIISLDSKKLTSRKDLEKYHHYHNNVIFINNSKNSSLNILDLKNYINDFSKNYFKLKNLLLDFNSNENPNLEIKAIPYNKNQQNGLLRALSFISNQSVLVNYNYDLCWKTKDPNQTIYHSTPSHMFLFGKGSNTLDCR